MIQQILDAAALYLESETGAKVLYDPQPVRKAEPHIRLTYMGAEDKGIGAFCLNFQLSLVGAGDGPGVYLAKIIELSLKLTDLYNPCRHRQDVSIPLKDGGYVKLLLISSGVQATGVFSQNEQTQVETAQWNYLFTESRYISIEVPELAQGDKG